MTWGVPIVATPNAGAEDRLRNGAAGLIIELESLGGTLESDDLCGGIEAAGRARAADLTGTRSVRVRRADPVARER
jgi:hypothetical protein